MSEEEYSELNITNLNDGAINELFHAHIDKIMKNIDDPNTEATDVREITFKISFKPDEKRETTEVRIKSSSKLAGIRATKSTAFLVRKGGKIRAFKHNMQQENFGFNNVQEIATGTDSVESAGIEGEDVQS